jgi:2-oxo-4-hydroxy-4-carboxy-5-ureidoimidazoline decarboxylase
VGEWIADYGRNNMVFYSIADLNQMSQEQFVEVLGTVFEETPTIARQAWEKRPFSNASNLHQTMLEIVNGMGLTAQLNLIRAHPDLGSKAKMAEDSLQEQARAGLDRLSPDEYQLLQSLNQTYEKKFGFPFIVAVKNHTKTTILEAFAQRLENSVQMEHQQALAEIAQIAWFRIEGKIYD